MMGRRWLGRRWFLRCLGLLLPLLQTWVIALYRALRAQAGLMADGGGGGGGSGGSGSSDSKN